MLLLALQQLVCLKFICDACSSIVHVMLLSVLEHTINHVMLLSVVEHTVKQNEHKCSVSAELAAVCCKPHFIALWCSAQQGCNNRHSCCNIVMCMYKPAWQNCSSRQVHCNVAMCTQQLKNTLLLFTAVCRQDTIALYGRAAVRGKNSQGERGACCRRRHSTVVQQT